MKSKRKMLAIMLIENIFIHIQVKLNILHFSKKILVKESRFCQIIMKSPPYTIVPMENDR